MEQIAQQFTDFYYSTFDANRNQLVNLYVRFQPPYTSATTLQRRIGREFGLVQPVIASRPSSALRIFDKADVIVAEAETGWAVRPLLPQRKWNSSMRCDAISGWATHDPNSKRNGY